MIGEILSCPDCGLDLEVKKIEENDVIIERIDIESEDWGE
jgi:lysine biosynthesis protein LysW